MEGVKDMYPRKHKKNRIIFSTLVLLVSASIILLPVSAQTPPTVSDFTKTGVKNESVNITAADFSAHFTDTDTPAQTLQKIKITELPETAAGTLKTGNTAVAVDTEIAGDSLDSLMFVPTTDWTGSASFKWKGSDGTDYSENAATVNITIAESTDNQPPIASDMSITTEKNESISGKLKATDADNDPLVFSIDTQPQSGTVKITDAADGSFTYTPKFNQVGADSFKFKANDGTIDSNIATVTVMITEPAPPIFKYADLVNHWVNFSAGKLADRGVIIGEKIAGKYYFYPEKVMNRAEFNLFLNAALGIDSDTLGAEPAGFDDEDKIPIWALHEARAAKKKGLINGAKVGNKLYYNAYDKINRLETLVILHNALKPAANNEAPLEYADKDKIPSWAVQYVKNMRSYGIMKGYPNNTIAPFETITRAQAAELLHQLVKYKELNP